MLLTFRTPLECRGAGGEDIHSQVKRRLGSPHNPKPRQFRGWRVHIDGVHY